jgi:hypothetical protein
LCTQFIYAPKQLEEKSFRNFRNFAATSPSVWVERKTKENAMTNEDNREYTIGEKEAFQMFQDICEDIRKDPSGSESGFRIWAHQEKLRRKNIKKQHPEYNEEFSECKAHALWNEKYPAENDEINDHWKVVRLLVEEIDPLERLYNQFGTCSECGIDRVLTEHYLTFCCDHPDCENSVNKWYEDYHAFRRNIMDNAEKDLAEIHESVSSIIIERANKKKVPIAQEWADSLINFTEKVGDELGLPEEETRALIPELIHQLKDPEVGKKFL